MAILEDDFDNIRAAIAWALERQSEAALRLVGALYYFWCNNGSTLVEGRVIVEALTGVVWGVARPWGSEPSSGPLPKGIIPAQVRAEAKALLTAGMLAFMQGDYLVAQSRFQAAEARAREVGDRTILGTLLIDQGLVKLYQGDHTEARALYAQSVVLARHAGNVWGLAYDLWLLGDAVAIDDPASARKVYEESLSLFRQTGDHYIASNPLTSIAHLASEQGDYTTARALLEESLAIRRQQRTEQYITSIALNSLAEVMCHQQDYESAAPLCEEGLALSRAVGNKSGIAWSLRNLADVAAGQGDVQRAMKLLRESLGLYRELGQKRDIVEVLESVAKTELAQGRPAQAAVLWGAANALRQSVYVARSPNLQRQYDQYVAQVRAQLGDAALDAALADGHALTLEKTFSLVLDPDG